MKRKQIINCLLGLILFTVISQIYTNFSITINQDVMFNNKFNLKDKHDCINNQIHQRYSNKKRETWSIFYRLSSDDRYHYEFRFEFNPSTKNDNHRVMLILYGANRACSDLWDFSVGMRILSAIHSFGYSILAICSPRKTYDIDLPIEKNNDAKYIYLSVQQWINKVYYRRFQRYPLLYIHATSRGSKFAGLLCRILPIQAQILYIFPGHREAMLTPSTYDSDLQTRLMLDSTFANWFYFDFCYNKTTTKNLDNQILCPFHNDQNYFYPLPPSFFIYLKHDPYQREESYRYFLQELAFNSVRLGGILLNHAETLQFDILSPIQLNASYMQKNFHIWNFKPHAAQLFFEHFTNPEKYRTTDLKRQTCWCSDINFKYFEDLPHITMTWSRNRQNKYSDYVRDIRKFEHAFCEEVCGDLMTTHSMVSRNMNKTLVWMNKIDQIRRSLYLNDYLKRTLRIWMYNKNLLIKQSIDLFSQKPNWNNIIKEYQMYSSEYHIQDYFLRLNKSIKNHYQYFQWTDNPLLADYFIIPSDLMFFYFYHRPSTLNNSQFEQLIIKLNKNYFEILLTNIRTNFPYWTMASQANQIGANHILPIPSGRNMGILFKKTQNILKNVIQLVFTGIQQESHAMSLYEYRGIRIIYRHYYDVIIPQFTPLNINRSRSNDDLDNLVKGKKRLFYFAGVLSHSTSINGARPQLFLLWRNIEEKQQTNMTIEIQGKQYRIMKIISGHIETSAYIESIQSSVFSLCPEGFLPWSPRLYESIQIGAIPIILADNIVLPFERFIDWRSFSVKINVTNIKNITDIVYRISDFEEYIKRKLKNVLPYLYAFQWPYAIVNKNKQDKHIFQSQNDKNERAKNSFYYLSLELRCRRLEQWYGFTVNISTMKSKEAQRLACTNHPTICPCHNEKHSLAFQEYI